MFKGQSSISPQEVELMRIRIKELDLKLAAYLKADKLKDEFVTIVSHEIRTPLTIIKGNIANLRDGILGNLTEKQMRVVEMTNRNIDRLIRLINSLLDFANMENGHLEPHLVQVDVGALVREAVNDFETVAKGRNISLKKELPKNLPAWKTDPDLTIQILTNLIDHALQFAKKEAKVIVKENGNEIQITVVDDGPHIPNEEPGIIFSKTVPLYRPVGSVGHRGTGLILALCKEKVRWLKGRMWIENLSDGAKVHLVLPK